MDFYGFLWISMDPHGFSLVFMGFHGFSWVFHGGNTFWMVSDHFDHGDPHGSMGPWCGTLYINMGVSCENNIYWGTGLFNGTIHDV